jgi:hypothetical protein
MSMGAWLLLATGLGLGCLLLVRWLVTATDRRRPEYLWVWRHRVQ